VSAYIKVDIKKAEDLFKKLEGFKVDDRGKIFFNGREVSRLLVDGEDLVGDQYRILSKNIQAGLIEKVKVYTHYNQNRILNDVEQAEEIAIDLRFREDKKNKLNGSIETGLGMLSKHNVDLDAVGLFKKFKSVSFYDKNNIGHISSKDEFSSSNVTAEYQSNDKNKNQPTPLDIPVNSLPNIPNSYLNDNRDQELNLIGSFKAGSFKTIKIGSSISGLQKVNSAIKNMQYLFPGSESWHRTDSYRTVEKQEIGDLKVSYKNDNQRNRISNYELYGLSLLKGGEYLNKRQGVINDSIYERIKLEEKVFSFQGDETIKLTKGFILYTQMMYTLSNLNSGLNAFTLIPFFSTMNEMAELQQVYNSIMKRKNLSSSIYKNSGKINTRFGFQVNEDEKKMKTDFYDKSVFAGDNKKNIIASYSNWKTTGLIGFNPSKKIFMQVDFSVGEGLIEFKGSEFLPKTIFNLNYLFVHQKSPFNRLSSEISIAKKTPSIGYVFPSPLLGHNSTILLGILRPSFPTVKNIEINYQRSDFYRATQFSGNFAGSWIENDNSISLYNYPDYTIKSFFISRKSLQLRSNVHLEKYFNNAKLKTIFEYNGFYMKSPERVNNIDTAQSILSNEFRVTAVSNWASFLNIESGSSLANSFVFGNWHGTSDKKKVSQFRNFVKFKALLGKKGYASFQISSDTYNGLNTFYAGNGTIDWRITNSLHSTLMFHNLFNRTYYFENQNDLYGSISRIYLLQKRYMLFSVQLNF
jgi:hypothetical protein